MVCVCVWDAVSHTVLLLTPAKHGHPCMRGCDRSGPALEFQVGCHLWQGPNAYLVEVWDRTAM